MAKAGKCADEIVTKLNDMIPRGRIYFLVDTLEYLAKGGRIGGAKNYSQNCLRSSRSCNSKMGRSNRSNSKGPKSGHWRGWSRWSGESCKGGEKAHLCVLQVEAENEAEAFVLELKSKVPVSSIPVYELPPAIVVHAGPKAMGVGFFTRRGWYNFSTNLHNFPRTWFSLKENDMSGHSKWSTIKRKKGRSGCQARRHFYPSYPRNCDGCS